MDFISKSTSAINSGCIFTPSQKLADESIPEGVVRKHQPCPHLATAIPGVNNESNPGCVHGSSGKEAGGKLSDGHAIIFA